MYVLVIFCYNLSLIHILVFCVRSTLLWARIAARFANKASPATLNRATGVVLVVLGVAIMG